MPITNGFRTQLMVKNIVPTVQSARKELVQQCIKKNVQGAGAVQVVLEKSDKSLLKSETAKQLIVKADEMLTQPTKKGLAKITNFFKKGPITLYKEAVSAEQKAVGHTPRVSTPFSFFS